MVRRRTRTGARPASRRPCRPCRRVSKLKWPANAGRSRSRAPGGPRGRPSPPGRAATSGRRSRTHPRRAPRSRPGSRRRLRAVDDDQRAAGVGELGDRGRPAAPRPSSRARARATTSRVPRRDRGLEGRQGRRVVATVADVDEVQLDAARRAARRAAPGRRRARAVVVTTRSPASPVERPGDRRSCRRSWSGSGRSRPGRSSSDRRDSRPAPRPSAGGSRGQSSTCARPRRSSRVGDLGHRRRGLGRQRPDRAGVQVDAGGEGRAAPRGRPPAVPRRGGTGRPRPYDTDDDVAWPDPSILATTDWLAEQLGRPGIRVLDARWRPDGSAPAVHARRPHPGRRATSTGAPT